MFMGGWKESNPVRVNVLREASEFKRRLLVDRIYMQDTVRALSTVVAGGAREIAGDYFRTLVAMVDSMRQAAENGETVAHGPAQE